MFDSLSDVTACQRNVRRWREKIWNIHVLKQSQFLYYIIWMSQTKSIKHLIVYAQPLNTQSQGALDDTSVSSQLSFGVDPRDVFLIDRQPIMIIISFIWKSLK